MIYFLIKIKIIKEELFMYTDDSIVVENNDLIDLTGKMHNWKDKKKEKYKILKIKEGNDFKNLYIYYLNRNDGDYNDFIKSLIKFENASPRIQKLKSLLEKKKMLEKIINYGIHQYYIPQDIITKGEWENGINYLQAETNQYIKNVAIYLKNIDNKILFVKDKRTSKWMVPGGLKDTFNTRYEANKEFKEEVLNTMNDNDTKYLGFFKNMHKGGEYTIIYFFYCPYNVEWGVKKYEMIQEFGNKPTLNETSEGLYSTFEKLNFKNYVKNSYNNLINSEAYKFFMNYQN